MDRVTRVAIDREICDRHHPGRFVVERVDLRGQAYLYRLDLEGTGSGKGKSYCARSLQYNRAIPNAKKPLSKPRKNNRSLGVIPWVTDYKIQKGNRRRGTHLPLLLLRPPKTPILGLRPRSQTLRCARARRRGRGTQLGWGSPGPLEPLPCLRPSPPWPWQQRLGPRRSLHRRRT